MLVGAMVVLGGVTRLTGSGLSMVDWEPVSGVVPPMNVEGWNQEFERYRTSPEYRLVNEGMSLDEFKRIFWFEYAHRLLGRVIGLVFILPFLYFFVRRMIPPGLIPRLLLILALGGAQGLLGWWMVQSGLVHVPHVSAYRLAAHLGLAALVYAIMLWTAFSLLRPGGIPEPPSRLARWSVAVFALAAVTFLSGAFVAGLSAGLVYNTFPKMGATWLPPELFGLAPWWLNFFEDVVTVQFNHRVLAAAVFTSVIVLWWACRRQAAVRAKRWANASLAAVLLQLGLGITTLLLRVPISLAALHQANAFLVLTALLGLAFHLRASDSAAPEASVAPEASAARA